MRITRLSDRDGFTLVEVLVAMTVLAIGVFSVVALIDRANATTVTTRNRDAATNLARELAEGARSIPYDELSVPITTKLQSYSGLEDDRPGMAGWQIERRDRLYTVTASVCTVDDPGDGYGDHSLSTGFCANPALTVPPDKNPEDYKRLIVTAAWTQNGVSRDAHQTVLINNPGSAGGPAILSIGPTNFASPFAAASPTVLTFRATTSSIPATMNWRVDGVVQPTPPVRADSAGYQWTLSWNLGAPGAKGSVEDGPYLVSAEAFNVYGVSGPTRSTTVVLNRLPPRTPTGIAGGRSGDPTDPAAQRVDLEWLAVPDRDVIGYAVFRSTSSTIGADGRLKDAVEVCALADRLACADEHPPVTTQPLYYVVRAYDRDPVTNAPRANAVDHAPRKIIANDRRPNPPLSLAAVRDAAGNIVLTWQRPAAASPGYSGDGIDFYRVYRDGRSFGDRYTRVDDPGATVTFTDTQTDGLAHTYVVTAVDDNYAESDFSNEAAR